MRDVLLVGIGGFVGAIARYVVAIVVTDRTTGTFPVATLLINVTGSFLLGLLAGSIEARALAPLLRPLVAIGFLGAYTTFSTFSYETLRLFELSGTAWALLNVVASVTLGLAAAIAGLALGRAV